MPVKITFKELCILIDIVYEHNDHDFEIEDVAHLLQKLQKIYDIQKSNKYNDLIVVEGKNKDLTEKKEKYIL